ncbi:MULTISPECIES: hypothetical protein [Brevundimonas]|uniref:hypothetical protein n=1 Tax=Brevundimonas TaxID=41275 RepID=UPI0025BBE64D|nr:MULTISPECIES: hypothetical protein [Brevundimonas]
MIRDHRIITTAQAEVLTALNGNRSLQRAAFAGQSFRVTFDDPEPGREKPAFSEALILSMIEEGFLIATQAAAAWPARNVPVRPFCVRLTKEGDQERRRLLTGVTSPANDDAPIPHRAA